MLEENHQRSPQKQLRKNVCADTREQNGDNGFLTPDAITERNNALGDNRDG